MARKQTEKKPLDYYFNLKYPVTITPDEICGYVAEIKDLPGCFTQGETLEETYENMEEARRLWLEVAYEDQCNIPLPCNAEDYSGKFYIRTPKSLHRKLVLQAEHEGVSLNQYLVSSLSQTIGYAEAVSSVKKGRRSSK
jgi:antitoxin HicB